MDDAPEPVRIDVWLWAARLLKTRALAAEAIQGGRVRVNGAAVKASRPVRVGDELEVPAGDGRMTILVRGTAKRRGPASAAVLLYDETSQSRAARELHAAQRRLAGPVGPRGGPRPTKRDRRRLDGR
jgi:ribosome-associated heat shock protein Hsp15